MGLEDRIKRLEAAAGQARQEDEETARRRRTMDKLYFALENDRRALTGRDPLPTSLELEDTKDDVLHVLRNVIPHYRQHAGWRRGEGKEFLDDWQNCELEKLTELEKGADSDG